MIEELCFVMVGMGVVLGEVVMVGMKEVSGVGFVMMGFERVVMVMVVCEVSGVSVSYLMLEQKHG